jgi:hypothetical protein
MRDIQISSIRIGAAAMGLSALLAGCASPPPPPERSAVVAPPRVMTVITEQGPGIAEAGAGVDAMAVPLLIERKVPAVDPSMVQSNRQKIQALLSQSGDEQGAMSVGLQFGADVVLAGRAEGRCVASQIAGSHLKSYQGTVTVRAICSDDATVMASVTESAAIIALDDGDGTRKALQVAGRKALEKIIPDMLLAWNQKQIAGVKTPRASLSVQAALGPQAPVEPDVVIEPPSAGYQSPVAALWPLSPQGGVSSSTIPIITDTLYATLLKSQWFRLVTREDMAKILAEHKLQMSDLCDSGSQAAEYGKILNAQKMLIGTASKLGTTYQVVLKLVNVETGEIELAGQAEATGNVNVLMQLVKKAAADLLNKQAGKPDSAAGAKVAGN